MVESKLQPSEKSENPAILGITTLREAWLVAVRSADVDRLASLVADDVVIVSERIEFTHHLAAVDLKSAQEFPPPVIPVG